MDFPRDNATHDDLSSLSWVQEELRRTLEAAHKALRRYVRESHTTSRSDLDDVDPTVLRSARQHLHQGVGVLELVNVLEGAALLRASEALVQRYVAKPQRLELAGVESVERASFALLDYLGRKLAGKRVDPVALFPQLRALLELNGAERVHPADLWPQDFRWRPVAASPATGRPADARMLAEFERRLLTLVRQGSTSGATALRADCYALAAGSTRSEGATLWRIAAGFFEAWALGLLPKDVFVKRTASRVLAQLRQLVKGDADHSERLALDLLFYCACAVPAPEQSAPCLRAVRTAYELEEYPPAAYDQVQFGRFDPVAVQQARKRTEAAKLAWSDVAAGELHRVAMLAEPFSLVADSVRRLCPGGDPLADALLGCAERTAQRGQAPGAEQAMEVATALLYLEAVLDEGEFDRPGEAERVERLAQRLEHVARGGSPEPLDPWMEELYRRVADRQTMGSVVQELRATLSEIERQIDQYFRHPRESALLVPVPALLTTMRGVLTVLGIDAGVLAVLRMRDDVETLLHHEPDPHAPDALVLYHRLAANLGALGFLIDMLNVQPQMAKALFLFDHASSVLSPLMGRHAHAPDLVDRAHAIAEAVKRDDTSLEDVSAELQALSRRPGVSDEPGLVERLEAAQAALQQATEAGAGPATEEAAREHVVQAMNDFVATATSPIGLDTLGSPVVSSPMDLGPPPEFAHTGLEDDDEMREVFLEESREVLQEAREALAALTDAPGDLSQLTVMRRAFHTLKGSARMVGLNVFGEAAWAGEQLYNHWLASQAPATTDLRTFTADALTYFEVWVQAIEQRRDASLMAEPVIAGAEALRLAGELMRVPSPEVEEEAAPGLAPQADPAAALAMPPTEIAATSGMVDLELNLDAEKPPLFEPLQATQPAPLFEATVPVAAPQPEPAAQPELGVDFLLDLEAQASEQPVEPIATTEPVVPVAAVDEVAAEAQPLQAEDVLSAMPGPEPVPATTAADDEEIKVIGDLRLSIPLFNIYLNEADELSRRLGIELAEWSLELHRSVGDTAIGLAHSLAGSSATVGFEDLSDLARELEHALTRSQALGGGEPQDAALFTAVSDELRRLLHQFAAGFLRKVSPELRQQLAAWQLEAVERSMRQSEVLPLGLDTGLGELAQPVVPAGDAGRPASVEDVPVDEPIPVADALEVAEPDAVPAPAAETQEALAAERPPAELPVLDQVVPRPQVDREPIALAPVVRPEPVQLREQVLTDALELDIDQHDVVDAELFPIFAEEAAELLPRLNQHVQAWMAAPQDLAAGSACMRALHTFKGSARLAGAMRLGEMAHRFETAVQHMLDRERLAADELVPLQARVDALSLAFERLRGHAEGDDESGFAALEEVPVTQAVVAGAQGPGEPPEVSQSVQAVPAAASRIDWSRFATAAAVAVPDRVAGQYQPVRVRIQVLDRLVNMAGEVSIARARLEAEVAQMRGSLTDLTENLERLNQQLHDMALQADTQLQSRREAARAAQQTFDPLELDRYTRAQELTRMMAESVNDVATVRASLQRMLQSAEDELAVQGRLTRELQGDLLGTRMVEFESLSERLYRVVRQAAKETGKQVRLDIVGGSIEVDRSVLDRMTAAFEHLLRNSVTHGIEDAQARVAASKDPTGSVVVAVEQEGNEVTVEIRDDGAGLDLARIRERAVQMGLAAPDAQLSDKEISNLIFRAGLSTATEVTELAGRGVGMDVVRSDVQALGGRIETRTTPGRGSRFRLVLPLTTVVTQVVLLRAGESVIAVPSNLIELVQRATPMAIETAYRQGTYLYGGLQLPFYWLGVLLDDTATGSLLGRTLPVVIVRSAQQRVALHVDEVLGTHEVVVKNLGPQLARVPGLAGMTLLVSGAVALIYNPVTLAATYGAAATERMRTGLFAALAGQVSPGIDEPVLEPLVLVVDDSLTVRRVTKRLLEREGYRVALAKDGLEALESLAAERPAVVLCDIEMPRMDGFDLLRNVRSDARLQDLPVIMITSRIAEKHRDHALALGANHYLGKPYSEEELLGLVRGSIPSSSHEMA